MNEDCICLIVNWLLVKSRRTRLTKRTYNGSNDCSVLALIKVAHIVGKSVELNWVKFVVITGGIVNHLFKVLDIILGKFLGFSLGSWVVLEVGSDGGSEFLSVDLSIVVGVDHTEDLVGLIH